MNPYLYCRAGPVTLSDPSGLAAVAPAKVQSRVPTPAETIPAGGWGDDLGPKPKLAPKLEDDNDGFADPEEIPPDAPPPDTVSPDQPIPDIGDLNPDIGDLGDLNPDIAPTPEAVPDGPVPAPAGPELAPGDLAPEIATKLGPYGWLIAAGIVLFKYSVTMQLEQMKAEKELLKDYLEQFGGPEHNIGPTAPVPQAQPPGSNSPPPSELIQRQKAESEALPGQIEPKEIHGARPFGPEGRPGHPFGHGVARLDIASIINDPATELYRGINENGRAVDYYWNNGTAVITEAGDPTSVITSYGRLATKGPGGRHIERGSGKAASNAPKGTFRRLR